MCLLFNSSFGVNLALAQKPASSAPTLENRDEKIGATANPIENQVTQISPSTQETSSPQIKSENISANEQNRLHAKLKQNPWIFLHPFKANYTVYSGKKKLGSATRELTNIEGSWKIRRKAKLSKWFLNLKSDEFSSFEISDNKLLVNQFFTSSKVSFKKKKIIKQDFDWLKQIETGSKGKRKWELELKQETYDRMSHIIQIRADLLTNKKVFDYIVSYKGKRELYSYYRAATEKVETPFGVLDAIRMDRDDGNEGNSIWFCPEINYFPVRISKFEQDEAEVVLKLNKLEYTKLAESKVVSK